MSTLSIQSEFSIYSNLPIEILIQILEFVDIKTRLSILKQKYPTKFLKQRLLSFPRTSVNIKKIFSCFDLMRHTLEFLDIQEIDYQLKDGTSPVGWTGIEFISLDDLLENEILQKTRIVIYKERVNKLNILEKRKQNPDKRNRGNTYKQKLENDIKTARKHIIDQKKFIDYGDLLVQLVELISRIISNFKNIYYFTDFTENDILMNEFLLFKIYQRILLI